MDYDYYEIENQPNIATYDRDEQGNLVLVSGIIYDVEHSTMTNKNIVSGTWWKDDAHLQIVFDGTLSNSDKSKLDDIVEANI